MFCIRSVVMNGVGDTQGYPKRFVNVNMPKKYSDATFRIIRFFTVKMIPGATYYMLGCLKMVPWDTQSALREKWTCVSPHACHQT